MRDIKFRCRIQFPNGKIVTKILDLSQIETGIKDFRDLKIKILSRDQLIGRKDKNGIEICEGDKVQFKYGNFKKPKVSSIAWGTVGFWVVGWIGILECIEHYQVEVISHLEE